MNEKREKRVSKRYVGDVKEISRWCSSGRCKISVVTWFLTEWRKGLRMLLEAPGCL